MVTYEDGWQPIETAPKLADPKHERGPHILLATEFEVVAAVWWNNRWLRSADGSVMQVMDYGGPEWSEVEVPQWWRPMPTRPVRRVA